MTITNRDTESAAEFVRGQAIDVAERPEFHTAVMLGSGLGAVGKYAVQTGGRQIDYQSVPGMPQPAVPGHAGRLVIGAGPLSGILFLQGRVHYYEGHPLSSLTFAVRMLSQLGVRNFVVTNAAGGIRSGFAPGDLMVIDGHWTFLNVQQTSTSAGFLPNEQRLWNRRLRELALQTDTPLNVHSGVYAMMSGPNYETPAEVRMLGRLGVSAVGMSTVPEAITAASLGMDVLGVSCITNVASGLSDSPLDHAEVGQTASNIEADFTSWMLKLLEQLSLSSRQLNSSH